MSNMNSVFVESDSGDPTVPAATIRVAHVVVSLDVGGLERIVVDLVRVGRDRGQRPSVICLEGPGPLSAQVSALGVPLYYVNKAPGLHLKTIGHVRERLRILNPDVVHTHQVGALIYAGPAARRENVPVVVHTEHSNNVAKHRSLWKRARIRLLWRLGGSYADSFFCVSDDIVEAVRAYGIVPGRKVTVVPNGIDTETFIVADACESLRQSLGIPQGVPVVGNVARLDEVKRQDLLIRSFADIAGPGPKPHLLLVGDGAEMQRLQGLAASLGLSDRVHFAGYQPRPERFLHLMDIFVLSSRLEGMPLAILEAWAAGLPVIASRVGGVPKMITEGQTGLLFDPGDGAALSQAIRHLLARPEEARRLGEAGRDYVRSRCDLKVMADAYASHYAALLKSRAAHPPWSRGQTRAAE